MSQQLRLMQTTLHFSSLRQSPKSNGGCAVAAGFGVTASGCAAQCKLRFRVWSQSGALLIGYVGRRRRH